MRNISKIHIALFYLITAFIFLACNNNSIAVKKYGDLADADYKHNTDTIDGETLYFKTAISASTPQEFINLDTAQKLFIKHSLQSADSLIRKFQPESSIDNFTARTLDTIIALWNVDSIRFNCSKNDFVNIIGTAFGQFLVRTYKMKRVMVTDEYGTDYATTIKELNLTNFPLNSIVKAIEQKREGSLQQISLLTKREISAIKKDK